MKYLKKFENYASYEEARQNLILPNVSLCAAENEVYYEPYVDPYNGHAYVDLGLPSGTKWATMNVGATKPEEYGLYFAWGETQGYTDASTKAFTWANYKWTEDSGSTMSKYTGNGDGKTVLDLEDDAVAANWGGSWRMLTEADIRELINTSNCTQTWTTVNGINGYLFTSVTNGNTLFIPAAGYADNSNMYSVGEYGGVWSNSLNSSLGKLGSYLSFNSRGSGFGSDYRYQGRSVRGVVG